MSSTNRWILKTNTNGVSPTGFAQMDAPTILNKASDLLARGAQGACNANLWLSLNPVAAQATVTTSGDGTNGDTLTIGNIVITIVTSGGAAATPSITIAGSAAILAAAIADLINGKTHALYTGSTQIFAGICTASVASDVITLTAAIGGTIGNAIILAKSSSALTITHAFGASVAGTEGTSATFSLGL